MDDITQQVSEMYAKFPYPSPQARGGKFRELVNLLKLFSREAQYDLDGKSVLDAGTGTGHRVIEAAAAFKNTRFTAVDISEKPLTIARQTAAHEGVENIDFHRVNIMEDSQTFGSFDMVLSMGVIHHLADPAAGLRNLVRNLADNGILFLYIYGRHGGRERMRRKRIVSLLLNGNRHNFEQGISLVKELGFDSSEYGWNLEVDDEEIRNALIVDAYLHVNETLYDFDSIFELMRSSGLYGFLPYGLTMGKGGCLFDTRVGKGQRPMPMTTDLRSHIPAQMAIDANERLSLADKYRLIDLFFEPNGYTLMGCKAGALRHFSPDGRIMANMLKISEM
jgi:SAM-dependent methyltransferase